MRNPKHFKLFLVFLAVLGAVPASLAGQESWPRCVLQGVEDEGPIVVGTIAQAHFDVSIRNPGEEPSITLSIEQYLRGPKFSSQTITLPVDWTLGPQKPYVLRRPVWYSVLPKAGTRVLVMLQPNANIPMATCVLDMNKDANDVPTIQRMVQLESTAPEAKVEAMLQAVSDPKIIVRALAADYLTSPRVRDPQIRQKVFQHFAPIAQDPNNVHRIEALEFIKRAYDGFSTDSDVNYKILSFIADRMGDSDPEMRSIAVQCIHSKLFGGGRNRPNPSRIKLSDRGKVVQQLKNDVAQGRPYATQAQKVLEMLNAK